MCFHIHGRPHFPHDAVWIDQIRMPRRKLRDSQIHHRVILFGHFFICVRQQFKGQAFLCAKLLVRLLVLHADAKDHGILRVILSQVPLKIVGFDCASGGHILRIEIEHHPLALEIMQADGLSLLRIQCEIGSGRSHSRRFVSAPQVRADDGNQCRRHQDSADSCPHWFFPHGCLRLKIPKIGVIRPVERCAELGERVQPGGISGNYSLRRYFLGMGSFGCGEGGAEVEPGAKRFASGSRALQSTGGKDTRQKCGLAWANCTPTSATPFAPGLRSTTVQGISSPVVTCLTLSFCPSRTGSCNCSSAPCAFTISVLVCSTKSVPFTRLPETRSGTDKSILWLRR